MSRAPDAYGATSSTASPAVELELLAGAPARERAAAVAGRAARPIAPAVAPSCGAGVAKCSRTGSPSVRRAPIAAGSVAELLTTSRSPASERRAGREARVLDRLGAAPGHHQPDLVASQPSRLRRLARLERRGQLERERSSLAHRVRVST